MIIYCVKHDLIVSVSLYSKATVRFAIDCCMPFVPSYGVLQAPVLQVMLLLSVRQLALHPATFIHPICSPMLYSLKSLACQPDSAHNSSVMGEATWKDDVCPDW